MGGRGMSDASILIGGSMVYFAEFDVVDSELYPQIDLEL